MADEPADYTDDDLAGVPECLVEAAILFAAVVLAVALVFVPLSLATVFRLAAGR